MIKSTPIKIVIHPPEDRDAFEKIFIEATFEAIKQLAATIPDEKNRAIKSKPRIRKSKDESFSA